LPVAYLGAFLTGLRPALWRGTRLLPLLAGVGVVLLASQLNWQAALALSVLISVVMVIGVDYVAAERDFG
jgi:hypothetical protein